MTEAQHYRFQADRAKRLARDVADETTSQKLLQMAEEYCRYAERVENKALA